MQLETDFLDWRMGELPEMHTTGLIRRLRLSACVCGNQKLLDVLNAGKRHGPLRKGVAGHIDVHHGVFLPACEIVSSIS